jgi:hypothetical protein
MWLIAETWHDEEGKMHLKPLRDLGAFASESECEARIQKLREQPNWETCPLQAVDFHQRDRDTR